MQLELELQPPRGVTLLLAASAEAAWQGGIAEWFARVASQSWRSARPAVVVVPTRGHAQAFKVRLLAAGHSTLGLEFVTPPWLRLRLARATATQPVPREHLHLLLALSAEEEIAAAILSESERLAAISVRRTPAHLLRLLEQLSAAGVAFEKIDLPAFRPVVKRFRGHLAATGLDLHPEVDRQILAQMKTAAPSIAKLLVVGFHGAHWPLWHLLGAAVRSAGQATVVLQSPRSEAIDLDTAWIGTWEEAFGEAKPAESDEEPTPAPEKIFLAGLDTREQAHAITAAALRFLSDESCTRLGLLFPARGALSRLVAAALTREGIPHYDATGQMMPGVFEAADFWNWLELQRTPRLHALLRFLTALENVHHIFRKISRQEIANALTRALGALALDDLAILLASARGRETKGELISDALAVIRFLPDHTTFGEFLDATAQAFAELGWNERWREIEQSAASAPAAHAVISRTLYLRWLEEIARSFRVTRDLSGSHPYARVQLLTPAQAEDQSWSHLIFGGLNEGVWPGAAAGDFLPAAQVDALNQSVQKLNRAATRRGRQGEGHVAVREGTTLFLGAAQQRQLAQAQFAGLVESARVGLAFAVSVVQDETPERLANPSEFFTRAYHEAQGRPVSQNDLRILRDATRRWLSETTFRPRIENADAPDVLQTGVAYAARRDAGPSGKYDFALLQSPNEIKPLSVSDAEEMLKAPALVWMKRYLGVEGEEDATYAWNATIGKWTHDWLAGITGGERDNFIATPSRTEITERILAAAERKRAEVQLLSHQAGKRVPDWWESGWENALCLAQTLGRLLGTVENWPWVVPEWRLEAQPIAVGEGLSLLLRGRVDLLLANYATPPSSLEVPHLWIIDYKTGNKESLAPKSKKTPEECAQRVWKQVLKREALQLGLYALAARQLGAQKIEVSLLSPRLTEATPQLTLDDFAECGDAFRELARMQATGIFGLRGALRGAFIFTKPYPLATLAVDREIVDERWEKTHAALTLEEEAWW